MSESNPSEYNWQEYRRRRRERTAAAAKRKVAPHAAPTLSSGQPSLSHPEHPSVNVSAEATSSSGMSGGAVSMQSEMVAMPPAAPRDASAAQSLTMQRVHAGRRADEDAARAAQQAKAAERQRELDRVNEIRRQHRPATSESHPGFYSPPRNPPMNGRTQLEPLPGRSPSVKPNLTIRDPQMHEGTMAGMSSSGYEPVITGGYPSGSGHGEGQAFSKGQDNSVPRTSSHHALVAAHRYYPGATNSTPTPADQKYGAGTGAYGQAQPAFGSPQPHAHGHPQSSPVPPLHAPPTVTADLQLYNYLGTPHDSRNPVDSSMLFSRVYEFLCSNPTINLNVRYPPFGHSLLHRLSSRGYSDLVHLLLLMGADPNIRDGRQTTPLMEAASCGYTDTIALLYKYGGDINAARDNGSTAMRRAIKHSHVEATLFLLENGADVSAGKDKDKTQSAVPLLDKLVSDMPDVAAKALDLRTRPLYRCKGYIGATFTKPEWEKHVDDSVEHYQKKLAEKSGRSRRRRPSFDFVPDLGGLLDLNKSKTQGIMFEYDYTGTEMHGGNATTLRAIFDNERLELLTHPWTTHLLDHKWHKFAKSIFYRGFLVYLVYTACFVLASTLYREGYDQYDGAVGTDESSMQAGDIVRFVMDILTMILTLYTTIVEVREIWEVGMKEYTANKWNLLDIIQTVLVWAGVGMRILQQQEVEFAILAILGPVFFLKVLNYARTLSFIGPTVHMVGKMVGDIFKFLFIFLLFLFGFAHGLHMLHPAGFDKISDAVLGTFAMNLGDFSIPDLQTPPDQFHKILAVVLFIVYNIISPILLVNLLIAIMSDTYGHYSGNNTAEWRLEQSAFILAEQSRLNDQEYHKKFAADKLWVIDADKPIEGLAHFDDNHTAWRLAADTDHDVDPASQTSHMLSYSRRNGSLVTEGFPRREECSQLDLSTSTPELRQALLEDLLQKMNIQH